MNADFRHPEPRIATWLADGPDRATAERRHAIAVEVGRIAQRRVAGPFEIARQSRMLAAAAVVIALAALGVAAIGMLPITPVPVPTPSPSAVATPTTAATEVAPPKLVVELDHADRPMNATFVAPEDFDLARLTTDVGAGLVVFTSDPSGEQYYGLLEPGTYGIAVADVTDAREHGPATFHPAFGKNAIEFLDGLDASDGFVVEDRAASSLGALAAWSSRVSTEGEEWTHIDVERPTGGAVQSLSFLNASVIFVADLADAIVLVQVWADTPETLASWLPRAMVVVNSIEFDYTPCC